MDIVTNSAEETFIFAKKYAAGLRGGEIIGLIGDLGAGKTVFAKGLAAGLGARETVTSPTFVLMKIYPIRKKSSSIKHLCHIDAYRLKRARDLAGLGAEEYFRRADTVAIIEWADKIKTGLPKRTKYITIKSGRNNDESRKLIISQ